MIRYFQWYTNILETVDIFSQQRDKIQYGKYKSCFVLSPQRFEQAVDYVRKYARPLDQAVFRYEFENGSTDEVLNELQLYQNKDGGFGLALEPDNRYQGSSVLATTVAFQYINDLHLSKPPKILEPALRYLYSQQLQYPPTHTFSYYWLSYPPELSGVAFAPWWTTPTDFVPNPQQWVNPCVEVIANLLRYQSVLNEDQVQTYLDDLHVYFEVTTSFSEFMYYDYLCFKRLLPHVTVDIQDLIFHRFDHLVQERGFFDPKNIASTYPHWLVTETNSYLYQKYPDLVENALAVELERIAKDGAIHPNWKWGSSDLWSVVEKEWSGKLTVELLCTLKYCSLLDQ